ncbi:MAG TPA: cytochrome ubiquinol oxidase subunit I [Thiobacillaceae bacterium]|nr:cytochrome ubiquinol oxidase subunit I [Thiobacillaceae bacterium]
METIHDPVALSRLQFALTTLFHILWPVLSIGLAFFLVTMEALWLRTGDEDYRRHAKFWSRLFGLSFTVGVVSGIPLEFEFGTNWAPFSVVSGEFFGNILGFEAAMAFMLEAGFVGIMLFGWTRVSRSVHFFATLMVATGASLSAFWIMVANAWMQTPAGGHMAHGVFVVDNYRDAIFNPAAGWSASHMWVACVETTLFVIGGISAGYLYRRRHTEFFLKSFKLALLFAIIAAPLQIWLGDGSGRALFVHQPAKAAAIEAHWTTNPKGHGAAWAILAWPNPQRQQNDWAIEIPNGLSLLATHSLDGRVEGLTAFTPEDRTRLVALVFYSFRLMVAIGIYFVLLACWTVSVWLRGALAPQRITSQRWLLRAWIASVPLGFIAVETGWITREVGRQPWTIYHLVRTADAVSNLPAAGVAGSLFVYALIYAALSTAFLIFARRLLRHGPDMALQTLNSSDPGARRS